MAQKPRRNERHKLPKILREPLGHTDRMSAVKLEEQWQRRWIALFEFFNVPLDTGDACRRLTEKLAARFVPGLSYLRDLPSKRGKAGRPPLVEDTALLIANVDHLIAKGKRASDACKSLSRMKNLPLDGTVNPFRTLSPDSLVNQHYKKANEVRSTVSYFAIHPQYFCTHYPSRECFKYETFEETDIDKIADLCQMKSNCRFRDRANEHINELSHIPAISTTIRLHAENLKRPKRVALSPSATRSRALQTLLRRAGKTKK